MVGIQVEMATNGQLAVDAVKEKEPGYFDLIFMDIQMPVMNGYEAAVEIRSSGREDLERIPIIAMTADAFADDIRKAKEAGMNDHIFQAGGYREAGGSAGKVDQLSGASEPLCSLLPVFGG